MVEGTRAQQAAQQAEAVASLQGTVAQHATMFMDILNKLENLSASMVEISKQNQPPKTT
jgi:uncharacterized coiled-coil protein SlyX